ncbi:UPF0481 protein At3g47200-like [Carya illinoinensis]|uniref:Uncharacterized protein n=1 Tax=Carya illinoinensis TaxID=32201 RepID=A0A8T1NE98_CARIL|nr:UPF0481 protein At3g47200-like [Carya illinoinensis]XP_042963216.1 UPF0481 protein At3g47200-like [Carya illinoinensis]XP_042963217.1 UPF0481 protein At3g47200-like [Carya illinoinensis]XP_042963218.1 UPF0481 protein At3g47200-like [Carya illinoinensis]XP_042963219.1 UPF0481 protein At3g47200-like [Carya illinoinensis]XP_042963220.1 UPF0481 protein At3g47200-like [Carya illinoinensis]KAG6628141.1 hypothetical protein CIPAW_15G180800 [Carya illinoinensis]
MEDVGEDFETSNQQSNDGTLDAVGDQLAAFGNIGTNFGFGGEEYYNPNEETQSGQTVDPEHAIQINDNERQKPVIINGSGWSTLKIPVPMFKVDKEPYIPMIVSIGPFHHNEPSLRAMQTQKRQFLDHLIRNRTGQPILEESLKNAMRKLEKKTREFYAYDFQAIKPDDFVQMMVLDGCFIVELLRFYEKKYVGEPFFKTRWTQTNISRDLLLLENQLPMFVLKEIFELTTLTGEATLITLALRFFEPLRPGKDKFDERMLNKHANGGYIHLLALFHSTLISGDNIYPQQLAKSDLRRPGKGLVHNAKILSYAGIKFKKTSGSILNINLTGKTLNIPTMVIDDSTSPMFRNLIAYEQNNCDVAPHFCCLALFLDSIVDTVQDVKILCDAGIIEHAMGRDEEVANIFNKLTKGLVFDINEEYCYMTKEIKKINRHCEHYNIRVRIRHLFSRLNFKRLLRFLDACFYIVITVIVIKIQSKSNNSNAYSSNAQDSPPPLPS